MGQCYVECTGTTGLYLWMPEHCMQRVMPRLMLAQRGSGCPQSQQQALPGMARTLWRALSPFRGFSLDSPPESRLPVDVDALLSSFWRHREKENPFVCPTVHVVSSVEKIYIFNVLI